MFNRKIIVPIAALAIVANLIAYQKNSAISPKIRLVQAATFNSSLLTGTALPTFDLGNISQTWRNLYLDRFEVEDGKILQKANFGGASTRRGIMVVGAPAGVSCSAICAKHTDPPLGVCVAVQFGIDVNGQIGGSFKGCSDLLELIAIPVSGWCFCP